MKMGSDTTLTCLSHSHTPVDFIIINVLIIQQKLEKKAFKLLLHLTIYKQLQLRFDSINYVCKGNSIKKLILKLTHQSCVFYGLNKYTTSLFGVLWVFIA